MQLLKHVYTNDKPLYLQKKLLLWPTPTATAPEEQQHGSHCSAMPFSFLFRKGRVKTSTNSASTDIPVPGRTPGGREDGAGWAGVALNVALLRLKLGTNVLLIELSHQCDMSEKLQWSWVEAGTSQYTAGKRYPHYYSTRQCNRLNSQAELLFSMNFV